MRKPIAAPYGKVSCLALVAIVLVTGTGPTRAFPNSGSPVVSTTSVSTICSISGQPAGIFLSVLSDSTSTPVVGANVTATHYPAGCSLNGVVYGNAPTTQQFVTNGSRWISLNSTNDGSYNFTVDYQGHNNTFTADLRPVSITCATIYVPSGMTDVTITEFQSSCNSTVSQPVPQFGAGTISIVLLVSVVLLLVALRKMPSRAL